MTTGTLRVESARVTTLQFDPADWLARFKAAGGWWMVGADEKICVGWRLDQLTEEQLLNDQPFPVRVIYREIESDTTKREALKCYFLTNAGETGHEQV